MYADLEDDRGAVLEPWLTRQALDVCIGHHLDEVPEQTFGSQPSSRRAFEASVIHFRRAENFWSTTTWFSG